MLVEAVGCLVVDELLGAGIEILDFNLGPLDDLEIRVAFHRQPDLPVRAVQSEFTPDVAVFREMQSTANLVRGAEVLDEVAIAQVVGVNAG